MLVLFTTILFGMASVGAVELSSEDTPVVVVLDTELGAITLEIATESAPVTAANFLKYVDEGFYDGGEFHRAVRPDNETRKDAPIEVVQARVNPARRGESYPPIPLERTSVTHLKHLDGTVSMARNVSPAAPEADSATSDIFICIGDLPTLDSGGERSPDRQGFAAFGKVIAGMDVVKRIQMLPTPRGTPATERAAAGQTLVPTVEIIRAYRK